jgi:carboxymethylenebutenolidase
VGDWFADPTSPTYDAAAASIAFSRTLAELRATIGPEHVDIETVWDDHISATFSGCETGVQTAGATSTLCMPTLVAGIREEQLRKFYESKVAGSPASLKMQLVNRIVGSDKIVDEMVVKFTHTCEVPWMLPGVVATGKEVEVLVVWMVMVRGGRVVHERLYWDQAGVLVQLGLIETAGLPVVDGRDCVRRVLSQR